MSKTNTHQKREGLFEEVYKLVRKIPKGKVSTYGIVAKQIGTSDARKIGWALAANSDKKTPCHRVVNKEGGLAKNFGSSLVEKGGWEVQKEYLLAEGVRFKDETHVDLEKCLYEY